MLIFQQWSGLSFLMGIELPSAPQLWQAPPLLTFKSKSHVHGICSFYFALLSSSCLVYNSFLPKNVLDGDVITYVYYHSAFPAIGDDWLQIDMLEERTVHKILTMSRVNIFKIKR